MIDDPIARMRASLVGLSVGDAFGQRFASQSVVEDYLADQVPPPAPWYWTDDTNMALSEEAGRLFGGSGSFGNGAAVRVAPLGAYFAEDLDRVVAAATKSAEVTHAHPEGIAGAVEVAVAAATAAAGEDEPEPLVETVIERTPEGETRDRLEVRPLKARPAAFGAFGYSQ